MPQYSYTIDLPDRKLTFQSPTQLDADTLMGHVNTLMPKLEIPQAKRTPSVIPPPPISEPYDVKLGMKRFAKGFLGGPTTEQEYWDTPEGKIGVLAGLGGEIGAGIGVAKKFLGMGSIIKDAEMIPEAIPAVRKMLPASEVIPPERQLGTGTRFYAGPAGVADSSLTYGTKSAIEAAGVKPPDTIKFGEIGQIQPGKKVVFGKPNTTEIGRNRIVVRGSDPIPPQSTGVPDVTVPTQWKPVTPAEEAFNARIPERYKETTKIPAGPVGERLPVYNPSKVKMGAPEVNYTPKMGDNPSQGYGGPGTVESYPSKIKEVKSVIDDVSKKGVAQTIQDEPLKVRKVASPLTWKTDIEDWYNLRNASQYSGAAKTKEFENLRSMGMNGILRLQDGEDLKDVRKYFDTKFSEVHKVFPEIRYRENYIPQLWDNSPEEIAAVFGGKLKTRPSFTFSRVLEDYRAGIKKDLKPKFDNIPDLIGWYETTANRAMADRKFFEYLKSAKLIKPTASAPKEWKALNPDAFPIILGKDQRGMAWSAPEEVTDTIHNVLMPDNSFMGKAARTVAFSKNMMLTGGIPHSGINWHTGVSIPTRALVGDGAKRMIQNYYYNIVPGAARSYLTENMGKAADAVSHGLRLGAEGFWATANKTKDTKNLAQRFESAFSDVAFKEIIPSIKLQSWESTYQKFMAKGMMEKEAKKAASQFVNDLYGGQKSIFNRKIGKTTIERNAIDNAKQMILLAPDWFTTKYKLGAGAAKGLLNPSSPLGQKYLKTAAAMFGLAAVESAVGMKVRGKVAPSAGRMQNIPLGKVEGKEAEYVPSGTALDSVTIPGKVAYGVAKGNTEIVSKTLKSQLSSPAQLMIDIISKEDSFGNPLRTTDIHGNEVPFHIALENNIANILGYTVPQPIQSGYDLARGAIGPTQAAAQALELPVRFYNRK